VLCDVDPNVVTPVMDFVREKYGRPVSLVPDLRRILDDKGIDGVVIATHCAWHAAATIHVRRVKRHDARRSIAAFSAYRRT